MVKGNRVAPRSTCTALRRARTALSAGDWPGTLSAPATSPSEARHQRNGSSFTARCARHNKAIACKVRARKCPFSRMRKQASLAQASEESIDFGRDPFGVDAIVLCQIGDQHLA